MADPQWSEESFFKKEMRKWDMPKRAGGMNRDGFEKYPQMVYKAQQNPMSGKYEVAIYKDVISLDKTVVLLSAEQFNATCQMVVGNDEELARAKSDGWRESQAEAMEFHNALEKAVSDAAAVRAYEDRNMSPAAKAEIKRAEEATADHLPEIREHKRKPMSAETKAKLAESLRKAREAKAAKNQPAS